MASLRIRGGGDGVLSCSFCGHVNPRVRPCSLPVTNHLRPLPATGALSISRDRRRSGRGFPGFEIEGGEKEGNTESRVVADRRLDEWMTTSVPEIVKSLPEAPLFVQVYDEGSRNGGVGGGGGRLNLRTEKEVGAEFWDSVRAKWAAGEAPVPEGVIFVEELIDEDEQTEEEVRIVDSGERVNQTWGIVVQGKGQECNFPACYLLKTTRVKSGLGFCAVQFYLTRVSNFREKAKTQLQKCWLVRRPGDEL